MLSLTVIILVGNEERHIRRCLEKLAPLDPRQIVVVESMRGDRTHEIVEEVKTVEKVERVEKVENVERAEKVEIFTVFHVYPGYQAAQFDWALDWLEKKVESSSTEKGPVSTEWILRLDADEYLTDELIAEMQAKLPHISHPSLNAPSTISQPSLNPHNPLNPLNPLNPSQPSQPSQPLSTSVSGVILKRRHMWRDVWIRRGMYPTKILRLFRKGHGRSDGKLMDEHIVVDGEVVEFEHDFVDHSLITVEEWEAKHRNYAKREAQSFLSGEKSHGAKGVMKWIYYHLLPSFARPAIYWFKRAIISGAYFESPEARDFTYRHAYWYRTQVEKEIKELRQAL